MAAGITIIDSNAHQVNSLDRTKGQDTPKGIKIGNNVRCGANTLITDSDWHMDDPRSGPNKDVVIGDNVWLGYGVKVLKGVHIGENSLIGIGSVVTKDIPANVIAAGNPCKVIKSI